MKTNNELLIWTDFFNSSSTVTSISKWKRPKKKLFCLPGCWEKDTKYTIFIR